MPNGTCCACASAKPAAPPSLWSWAARRPCCGGSVEAWRCCGASQNWRTTWSGTVRKRFGGGWEEKKAFLKGVGDRNSSLDGCFFGGGFVLGSLNDARLVGRFVGSTC